MEKSDQYLAKSSLSNNQWLFRMPQEPAYSEA